MHINFEQIMSLGIHFGHFTTSKHGWNPKIKVYVFTIRSNIYIIDLIKSRLYLERARRFVIRSRFLENQHQILLVGTTVFLADYIKNRAFVCNCFYVNKRWLGGILTNWTIIKSSLIHYQRLEREYKVGYWKTLSKKQAFALTKRLDRFNLFLVGCKGIRFLPVVVIIAIQSKEFTALHECRKLSIPIISTLDTNCDPSIVTIGVPINEDSVLGVKVFLDVIVNRYIKKHSDWYVEENVSKKFKINTNSYLFL